MKSLFTPVRIGVALLVVFVVAAVLVIGQARRSAPSAKATPSTALPQGGETPPLEPGLGPEWKVIRQTALPSTGGQMLTGTRSVRETLVQLKGGTTLLMLTELEIRDSSALASSLRGVNVRRASAAGRDGYIVPTGGLVSASAFTLVGTSTVLLIEYGDTRWGNFMEWPDTLDSRVTAAISRLRMP